MMPDWTRNQYNALIHAIWLIDTELKTNATLTDTAREKLERDRTALTEIHIGQFKVKGA